MYRQCEKEVGKDKLYLTILVDCTTAHDTFLEQFVGITIRLISKEFSSKSWNYYHQFKKHIAPRKNWAKAFDKQRFNRFVYGCALIVHYLEVLRSFLHKFEHE